MAEDLLRKSAIIETHVMERKLVGKLPFGDVSYAHFDRVMYYLLFCAHPFTSPFLEGVGGCFGMEIVQIIRTFAQFCVASDFFFPI